MKKDYENALKIMLGHDEELSQKIKEFMEEMPDILKSRLERNIETGEVSSHKKRWMFYDDGVGLSLSVGTCGSAPKDFMSIYLEKTGDIKLRNWPKYDGDKLIGGVTFYLYNSDRKDSAPTLAVYDFYAKRVEDKLGVTVVSNMRGNPKLNAELLQSYGLKELNERICLTRSFVNIDNLINNSKR